MAPEQHPSYPHRPMRPEEVHGVQMETFPEEVFVAVNGLIAERRLGELSRFTVKALRERMVELGLDQKEIGQRGWDRIGAIYQQAGWEVSYHSPSAWDDGRDYDPYYVFKSTGHRSW